MAGKQVSGPIRADWRSVVLANQALVYYWIGRLRPKTERSHLPIEDLEDLIQWALVKSSMKWDENKGRFSTYASRVILNDVFKKLGGRNGDGSLDVAYVDEINAHEDVADDVEEIEQFNLQSSHLARALRILRFADPRMYKIVMLKWFSGVPMTWYDVADVSGIAFREVKLLWAKAKGLLQQDPSLRVVNVQ